MAVRIKVTAIQTPSPDNTVTVARQLKESVEVGQRLRGDPEDSFVRVNELTQGGLWKLVNGVLVPGTIAAPTSGGGSGGTVSVTNSVTGDGSVGTPLQLSGDAGSPGNTMLYGTNGSGTKGWYAQPAAGTPGAVIKISEQILGSAAASVTFSSIPNTFRNLLVTMAAAASVNTAPTVLLRLNGDSANNYSSAILYYNATAGTAISTGFTVVSAIQWASLLSTNATANSPGAGAFRVHDYARTVFTKAVTGTWQRYDTSSSFFGGTLNGIWNSTAVVSSMVLSLSSGNFVTGSVFSLYGES